LELTRELGERVAVGRRRRPGCGTDERLDASARGAQRTGGRIDRERRFVPEQMTGQRAQHERE
jgi:hypothetical protein